MTDPDPDQTPPDLTGNLYALITYLHASSNRDLLDGITREQLNFGQLLLLERLRGGRIRPTIRQAAAIMHVSDAGASRLADGLARRDLIHREADEDDYRARRLVITDQGEAVIARLHGARLEHVDQFAQTLSPAERDELEHALDTLLDEHPEIRDYRPPEIPA